MDGLGLTISSLPLPLPLPLPLSELDYALKVRSEGEAIKYLTASEFSRSGSHSTSSDPAKRHHRRNSILHISQGSPWCRQLSNYPQHSSKSQSQLQSSVTPMLQGEGEAGEGGEKETLEGGSHFYPRGASSFRSMLAFHNPPTSIPSFNQLLGCFALQLLPYRFFFPLRSLNQPNEPLPKNMGLCPLEIMSCSNSFAFSISPFLHNPSIGAFDVVTCRTLIDGLCETGQLDKEEKLLLTMISGDHEPNRVIYTALIDGLCKKGEIKKVKKLLTREMG